MVCTKLNMYQHSYSMLLPKVNVIKRNIFIIYVECTFVKISAKIYVTNEY